MSWCSLVRYSSARRPTPPRSASRTWIDPKTLQYQNAGKYPACAIYETDVGEQEMADFVRRNTDNCSPKPGEEICHKQYHYSDIPIQEDHYDSSFTGARPDDVEHAITAAIQVLKGQPAPQPFNIKSKREALLLLSHYVGDIHQPLHVAAVYLDASGSLVNPDQGTFDSMTDTKGGNKINVGGSKNLHATWDDIPVSLEVSNVGATMMEKARGVPQTSGEFLAGRRPGPARLSSSRTTRSAASSSARFAVVRGPRRYQRATRRQ